MGKLVWPTTMTRVDAAYAVNSLCTMVQSPSEEHYKLALGVLGYLSNTRDLGITFGGSLRIPYGLDEYPRHFLESHGLYTAHDSSWGTKARPMGGYVVMYNNGAVDWSAAATTKIVPASSHEAESAVGSKAAKATMFVRELLKENGASVTGPTPVSLAIIKPLFTSVQQEGSHSSNAIL